MLNSPRGPEGPGNAGERPRVPERGGCFPQGWRAADMGSPRQTPLGARMEARQFPVPEGTRRAGAESGEDVMESRRQGRRRVEAEARSFC